MSELSTKNHTRNTRSKANPANPLTVQTPTPIRSMKKTTNKVNKNNDQQASSSTPAATTTVPAITTKRKSSSSPTTIDINPSAKKQIIEMATNQNIMEQLQQLFTEHADKMASDLKSQFIAHTESVKTDIKSHLDAHTSAVHNEIKIQLDSHASSVQSQIKSLGDQLKSELSSQINDVNNKIDSLQHNVSGQLISLQTNVDGCIDRINTSEDDVRRIAKLNELKIKGIPYTPDENLQTIFQSISRIVGFDMNGPNRCPELYRTQMKSSAVSEPIPLPKIIVKFVAKHIRDEFYSLYLTRVREKPLKTDEIQLSQGGRIIISENLTTANQQIFTQAMKMKYDKKLAKVYTKDGLIYVKRSKESKPMTIRLLRDLNLVSWEANTSSGPTSAPLITPSTSSENMSTAKAIEINNSSTVKTGSAVINNVIPMQTN